MRSLTIKQKLILLAIFSLSGLVLVGSAGWVGVSRLNSALRETNEHSTPAVVLMAELRTWQLKSLLVTREVAAWQPERYERLGNLSDALSDSKSIFESVLERRGEAEAKVSAAFKAYQTLEKTDGEAKEWEEVQQRLNAFRESYDRLLPIIQDMAKTDNWDALKNLHGQFKIIDERISGVWEQADSEIEKLNGVTKNYAEQVEESARETQVSALSMIGVVCLSSLFGVGLIALMIVRNVTGSLDKMKAVIVEVAETNDFTKRIEFVRRDEVGETSAAFNRLLDCIGAFIRQVSDNAIDISEAADNTLNASRQLAGSSAHQNDLAIAIASAVEAMTSTVSNISSSVHAMVGRANDAGMAANQGEEMVSETATEMDSVTETVGKAEVTISELGAQSGQISRIVQVIKDVADQTNLLALNAAIEAARAGEMGRGFAVVADEVRKLAERTSASTVEIGAMVADMQRLSSNVVDEIGVIISRVHHGKDLSAQAAERILAIRENSQQVSVAVKDISASLREHAATSDAISERVETVAKLSEENASAAAKSETVSEGLHALAVSLRSAVSRFKA